MVLAGDRGYVSRMLSIISSMGPAAGGGAVSTVTPDKHIKHQLKAKDKTNFYIGKLREFYMY